MGDPFVLRPATLADSAFLLALRNDPDTVANSLVRRPASPEEHTTWLARAFADSDTHLYILEHQGTSLGMGRLVMCHEDAELSLAVMPQYRGTGWGKFIIVALRAEASRLGARTLSAVALGTNVNSLRAFLSCGFHIDDRTVRLACDLFA